MPRLTRQQRRELRTRHGSTVAVHPALEDAMERHPSNQAAPPRAPAPPPRTAQRGGLVKRAKARLARRYVDREIRPHLPVVAKAAVVVVGAVLLVAFLAGVAIGVAMAAGMFDQDADA